MSARDRILERLTDPRIEPRLYLVVLLLLLALVGLVFAALGV